jgi:hypothetical protein
MERKARVFGQLLGLALIVIAGIGLHTYSLGHRLEAAMDSFGALEQDRNLWKSKAEEAGGIIDMASTSLTQCSAQVDDLKARLTPTSHSPS